MNENDEGFAIALSFFNKISKSREIKEKSKFLIESTKATGVEHSTPICMKDNTIFLPNVACKGIECMVRHGQIECPLDSDNIGSLHTHPPGEIIPSPEDIEITEKENIFCIGGTEYNIDKVKCFYPGHGNYVGELDLSKERPNKMKIEPFKLPFEIENG